MIDKAPSPLRQRMIEDMTVRHFKEKVQKDYIFTAFLGRSPATATNEDLRLFQLLNEEPGQPGECQLHDRRAPFSSESTLCESRARRRSY
jgi:hypothetical protein